MKTVSETDDLVKPREITPLFHRNPHRPKRPPPGHSPDTTAVYSSEALHNGCSESINRLPNPLHRRDSLLDLALAAVFSFEEDGGAEEAAEEVDRKRRFLGR
ncbi:unnamed protein product [Camellia sinensis]